MSNFEAKMVRGRYDYLNLSDTQVLEVIKYESLRDSPSEKHSFSQWEEFDFEEMSFRLFLNEVQFSDYLGQLNIRKAEYELEVRKYDLAFADTVLRNKERLKTIIEFVEQNLFNDSKFELLTLSVRDKHNLLYLKAEYKKYLCEVQKKQIVNFAKYCRGLCPNEWQASLLGLYRHYVIPDYNGFKRSMDEATISIASKLEKQLTVFPFLTYINEKIEELEVIVERFMQEELKDIDLSDPSLIIINDSCTKEELQMNFLLIDKDFYGLSKY